MNTAAEIKQLLDIVTVISEYVRLEKAGRNLKALCPFHAEKTPSFFVFPERQSWRCFGCGVGGDLISFVMRKEGLDFGGALKTMAQKAGVPLVEKKTRTDEGKSMLLYRINETAAQYYHRLLLSSPLAQGARKYVQGRGLGEEILGEFQMGFSLDEWEDMKQHLRKQGYREADLVAAGLVVEKGGRTYDRFRGRLMFPIRDAGGRVGGFGARALDDSIMPKYLNSAASPIFDKSSILYGMDRARGSIREQGRIVIVEGYMDALTAHQHGFRNVVASMGTAVTEKQIAVIKGLTTHVCLCLDPDVAGDAATLRGIEACRRALDRGYRPNWLAGSSELRARISIIPLPEGKDPDQVIRESADEWRSLVDGAQPLMEYLLAAAAEKFDLSRSEGKTQVSQQLLPLIAEMQDGVEREVYLGKLSRLVELKEKTLAGMAAQLPDKGYGIRDKGLGGTNPYHLSPNPYLLEEYCLCLLLKYPSLRGLAGDVTPDHFERSENREVFVAWQTQPDDIRGNLDVALHEYLQSLIDRRHPPLDKREQEQALADCICRLEGCRLRSQLVFEAESALETGGNSVESSIRLTELQRRHATLGWR